MLVIYRFFSIIWLCLYNCLPPGWSTYFQPFFIFYTLFLLNIKLDTRITSKSLKRHNKFNPFIALNTMPFHLCRRAISELFARTPVHLLRRFAKHSIQRRFISIYANEDGDFALKVICKVWAPFAAPPFIFYPFFERILSDL